MAQDVVGTDATALADDPAVPARVDAADRRPPRHDSRFREWIPVASAVLVVAGLALLIALPRGFSAGATDPEGGYYQRLADGFLHGELSIRDRPPKWLVDSKDPYEPSVSSRWVDRYGRWDASLDGDRVYYYWGPAPVVLFVVPLRLIGIHATETDIGIVAALVIIVTIGLLVRRVAKRWPMPRWLEFFTALGLASAFSCFFLLRYVGIWQATVLAAGAFGGLALLAFVSAALTPAGRRARVRWLLGGIALACAIGTRPTYAAFGLVPLVLIGARYLRVRHRGVSLRSVVRPLVAALGPAVLALLLFAVYNQARFGSPTDFGLTHTLSPVYDQSTRPLASLGYTLPNAYYYLVRPLSLAPVFPFLSYDAFQYPFGTPASYSYNEPVLGILTTSPLLVLGIVITLWAAFARRTHRDRRFTMSAALSVIALITVLAVSTSIYGATQRYRVETDLLLTAAAVAAISLAWSFLRRAWVRRAFTWCVGALAVLGLVLAVLAGYQDRWPFTDERNGFGNALADVTSPISDAALSGAPYVTVEPAAKHSGPITLSDGFLLYPTARLIVHARGDCGVHVVLHRDLRDLQPLSVSAHGAAHVDVSKSEIVIDVPPGGDEQVIPLTTSRYDGFPFTNISSGASGYDCSSSAAAG